MIARRAALLVILATAIVWCGPPVRGQARLETYNTRYYVIHSDLDVDSVREAALRMTTMAEEYHRRTAGFTGTVRERLPFYLYRRYEDYLAAGAERGTAGMFTGDKLMAFAGQPAGAGTWYVVQHEGFHQFVHAAIGGDIPIWVNEGMAEYFGQAIFTGDGYVVGVIPPSRLARVKQSLEQGRFKSLRRMMLTSREAWVGALSGANYDQAWSMVYFLAHAEDGKYAQAFDGFIREVGRGRPWERAWVGHLGTEVAAFQDRWREYWENLPENPTADLYAEVVFAILNSYYARAFSRRQFFDTAEAFFDAARARELKAHPDDWLPPSLLSSALERFEAAGTWSIEKRGGRKALICTTPLGTEFVGRFRIRNRRALDVRVDVRRRRK